MIKKMLMVIAMMFCMVSLASAFTVDERPSVWGGDNEVEFTINNNDEYADIMEVAIGNNGALAASVDSWRLNNLSEGYIAQKDTEGHWMASYYRGGEILREIRWMDDLTEFNDYQYAFLFTSWHKTEENSWMWGNYLEMGETVGYLGFTEVLESPFAAYSFSQGAIVGETTHSSVPIPGAVWLLGSGLGLIALRKKNE